MSNPQKGDVPLPSDEPEGSDRNLASRKAGAGLSTPEAGAAINEIDQVTRQNDPTPSEIHLAYCDQAAGAAGQDQPAIQRFGLTGEFQAGDTSLKSGKNLKTTAAPADVPPPMTESELLQLAPTNKMAAEVARNLEKIRHDFPAGADRDLMERRQLQTAYSMLKPEVQALRALDPSDPRPIYEQPVQQVDNKTFELGLTYSDTPPLAETEPGKKLQIFATRAYERAAQFITSPSAHLAYLKAQQQKLIGIGEGLNEAKEGFKKAVAGGFMMVTDGTLAEFLSHPNAINEPLMNAAQSALDEMARNPNAVNDALWAASEAVVAASEKYSHLSDREKGRVIGEAMFGFINPEGSLEGAQALGKIVQRSDEAINAAVELALASRTAGEARAKLQMLKDMAGSPELKAWLGQELKSLVNVGPQPAFAGVGIPGGYAIEEMDSAYLMSKADGDSWFKRFWKRKPEGGAGAESGAAKGAERSAEELSKLTPQEAAHAALDKMIAENTDLKPLRALTKSEEEYKALVAAVEKHHSDLKAVLKDTVTQFPDVAEDIAALENARHKFYFPNRLEDIDRKLARELMFPERPELGTNSGLRGATLSNPPNPRTILPREIQDPISNDWVLNSNHGSLDNVMRHELGMSLIDIRGWKSNIAARLAYESERKAIIAEYSDLLRIKDQVAPEIFQGSFSNELQQFQKLESHLYGAGEYGFDQTLADLYAGAHGGSALDPSVQALLEQRFSRLREQLHGNNWFRKAGD